MRLPVNQCLPPLAALILLAGCVGVESGGSAKLLAQPQNGPAADYPVVLGDPFTIGDTVWTPADQLSYDAVGKASVEAGAYSGVTAAHKTLPLPSYAEVTTLDTGRTIVVRIERRGPMANDILVELSRDAAQQLGISEGSRTPVRLRRTNPPEQERAVLRSGGHVPERMKTPEALLKVLSRKFAAQSPLMPAPVPRSAASGETSAPKSPSPQTPEPAAGAPSAALPTKDALMVQVGAFSIEENADRVARQLGGFVSKPGRYWLVRAGPFANRAQAAPVLEKARAAGYRDARIQHAD